MDFIGLLPAKVLYFGILIVWSMTKSIIQSEPFPNEFIMLFIIVVYIDRTNHQYHFHW